MAKHVLNFKVKPPKLKYLKPDATTISLTFTVNAKDVNPLFLQELSDRVRADYLVPLSETWSDMWVKWDNELEAKIPTIATKTKSARKKLLETYADPFYKEYDKQIGNITTMAQKIGDRYWSDMARQRTEIRNEKLLVGAKVIWKGCTFASALSSIITSGGTAVSSYYGALKSVHDGYKILKKYYATADQYYLQVYKGIESMRTNAWKRSGYYGGGKISFEDLEKNKKAIEKLNKEGRKIQKELKNDINTFALKVGQVHQGAGSTAKDLDKALATVEDALAADPSLVTAHRAKLMSLILDVQRIGAEVKNFEKFEKMAEKYARETEAALSEELSLMKYLAKAAKYGSTMAAREITETFGQVSANMVAAQLAAKKGVSLANFLKGWDAKIDGGLKAVQVLIKAF